MTCQYPHCAGGEYGTVCRVDCHPTPRSPQRLTRDEIIKLALEAGGRMYSSDEVDFFLADLERFANLVAAAIRAKEAA